MLEARALTAAEGSGESLVLPLPLKLLGTDLQQDMADLSVDILGDSALPRVGYGFGEGESGNQPNIREQGPATMRSMLSGRASTIYGGTSEVQRGIMSKIVVWLLVYSHVLLNDIRPQFVFWEHAVNSSDKYLVWLIFKHLLERNLF